MRIDRFKEEPRVFFEIGVLLSIPAVLLILHATVGRGTAVHYYFYPANPSLIDAWTAALLHSSWEHVGSNSLAYLITILTTYTIYCRWGQRRIMWLLVGVILVSTPPVVNFFNTIVFGHYLGIVTPELNMKGFSGIASAFLGMLWATIGFYTNHRTDSGIGYWIVFVAYLLIGIGFAMTYRPPSSNIIVVVAAIAIGLLLAGHRIRSSFDNLSPHRVLEWMKTDWDFLLMLWCIPVGLILVMALFPADPGAGGTMTNIVAHMSGLAFGFLISVVVVSGISWWDSTPVGSPGSS